METLPLDAINDAARNVQYDYIIFDAIFLAIWIIVLLIYKKKKPLLAGLCFGILVYLIDAIWWWNAPAGSNYPIGTYIREYWIGGIQVPHVLGPLFFLKCSADFMMTISYSLFAFAWLWIMFENFKDKLNKEKFIKESILFTGLYFGSWMLVPTISYLIPLNDVMVNTVRHMDTQILIWIVNVCVGYLILAIFYGSGKLGERNLKVLGFVFIIGCMQSFFMEFPLFIWGIRPTGIYFLIYEIFFLFNQGAPYLFIIFDKILPFLNEKLFNNNNKELNFSNSI